MATPSIRFGLAAAAATLLAATVAAHAGPGLAGPRIDESLGPWPVERQLLPPGFFVTGMDAAREAPRPPGRLLSALVASNRLPPATRRIALHVVLLLQYGANAMTGITRKFDPSGRGRPRPAGDEPGTMLKDRDFFDDPWSAPCADRESDHAGEAPGPGVAVRQPLLDVDALPAFEFGEPTAATFWIHLDAEWPVRAETAALDAAPPAVGTEPLNAMRLVMHSTSLAFLGAIVLVPAGCSFAAGTLYGRSRDGPRRPAD